MNLRMIECFLAIVREGTLTRAAEQLRTAPSALSRQLALLEHDVRVQLFARQGRSLVLSEEGRYLVQRVQPLMDEFGRIREELRAIASLPQGPLAVGFPSVFKSGLTVPVALACRQRYPAVLLKVAEAAMTTIRDELVAGTLDLGILTTLDPLHELEVTPLVTEPLVLAGMASAGLRLDATVSPDAVLDRPLIAPPFPNTLRRILDRIAQALGRPANVVLEVNLMDTLLDLVEAGQGFAILPLAGVRAALRAGRVSAAPIDGMQVEFVLARHKLRTFSPAMRAVAGLIEEHARSLGEVAVDPAANRAPGGPGSSRSARPRA